MKTNILLTGAPGCGKTTLLKRVVARLTYPVHGFYTEEIREQGQRRGFKLMALDGVEGILAHVDIKGLPRVGKYGVDVAALDRIGTNSIQHALATGCIVIIDEIGPMECHSDAFCAAVLAALASESVVLGTIAKRSAPFSDAIKHRPDVALVSITPQNRDALVDHVVALVHAAYQSTTRRE